MSFISPKSFYEEFKEDPESARRRSYQLGREMGQTIIQKLGIGEMNMEALAVILNEFQRMVQGEPNAKVMGSTIMMRCKGFCPVMRAALTLSISWQWLDDNYAMPMFHGLASLVIPGMRIRLLSAKSRGDPECLYLFEA